MPCTPTPLNRHTLITGSHGFVGHALASAMSNAGDRLRLAARTPLAVPGFNAEGVVIGTISPTTDWIEPLRGIQAVVHLAARVHVMDDLAKDPLEAFRTVNTQGTLRLAQQAADAGTKRFVFVSTVKVLGERSGASEALTERSAPAPFDPYAISKHEAEIGLREIAAHTGMEVVIIRPPLVYGPGVKANFAALMGAIARGWPMPLGALDNRRSLVALDNLVDFIRTCLAHPFAANECFLVSDDEDLSTTALLRRLGLAMGRPARLLPVPPALLRASATLLGRRAIADRLCDNLQVDITKARTLLGWTPPISVDEGLRRAVRGMQP
jgi:nucleoside-diphosphate-sugar epimerase